MKLSVKRNTGKAQVHRLFIRSLERQSPKQRENRLAGCSSKFTCIPRRDGSRDLTRIHKCFLVHVIYRQAQSFQPIHIQDWILPKQPRMRDQGWSSDLLAERLEDLQREFHPADHGPIQVMAWSVAGEECLLWKRIERVKRIPRTRSTRGKLFFLERSFAANR